MENLEEPKWYVLHTYSGYENVAKENLETVAVKYNLQDRIMDVVIPMEDVIEEKNGKKKLVQRKIMPGYILVKMRYGDDIWHNVTRTRGITGFTGPKGRPLELSHEELLRMQRYFPVAPKTEDEVAREIDVAVNEKVEIVGGPLTGTIGTITEVDAQTARLKVSVEMFGRETVVELDYSQVLKIKE